MLLLLCTVSLEVEIPNDEKVEKLATVPMAESKGGKGSGSDRSPLRGSGSDRSPSRRGPPDDQERAEIYACNEMMRDMEAQKLVDHMIAGDSERGGASPDETSDPSALRREIDGSLTPASPGHGNRSPLTTMSKPAETAALRASGRRGTGAAPPTRRRARRRPVSRFLANARARRAQSTFGAQRAHAVVEVSVVSPGSRPKAKGA